eukprot:7215142-Prymnesium_polylepis.2
MPLAVQKKWRMHLICASVPPPSQITMLPPKVQFKRRLRAEANRLAAIARRAKTIPCRLVGRAFHRQLALCPMDSIHVTREANNAHDANAHAVSAYTGGEWAKVGYVDRLA